MTITVDTIPALLCKGALMTLRVDGRKRTCVDARKVGRSTWALGFTSGPALTVPAGATFHRLAR